VLSGKTFDNFDTHEVKFRQHALVCVRCKLCFFNFKIRKNSLHTCSLSKLFLVSSIQTEDDIVKVYTVTSILYDRRVVLKIVDYSDAGRGVEYCDECVCWWVCVSVCVCVCVCLCVCLSVRKHISKIARPNVTKFHVLLHVAVTRFCSDGVTISYVLPFLWMTSCFPITGPMVQAMKICCKLKVIHQGQRRFDTATYT